MRTDLLITTLLVCGCFTKISGDYGNNSGAEDTETNETSSIDEEIDTSDNEPTSGDESTTSTATDSSFSFSSSETTGDPFWSQCFARGTYETCQETCESIGFGCIRGCGTDSQMSVWTTEHQAKCEQWYNCPDEGSTCGRDDLCSDPVFYAGQDNQAYRCCCW